MLDTHSQHGEWPEQLLLPSGSKAESILLLQLYMHSALQWKPPFNNMIYHKGSLSYQKRIEMLHCPMMCWRILHTKLPLWTIFLNLAFQP
jgi:hypothetical protein